MVIVRLVRAAGRRTLWSGRVRAWSFFDVPSVQREVTRRFASALGASLTPAEERRIAQVPTGDIGADDLYLRSSTLSDVNRAANPGQHLTAAPGNELAILRLRVCDGHAVPPVVSSSRTAGGFSRILTLGFAAARRALALQPDLGTAHFALGDMLGLVGRPSAARLEVPEGAGYRAVELPAMVDLYDVDADPWDDMIEALDWVHYARSGHR